MLKIISAQMDFYQDQIMRDNEDHYLNPDSKIRFNDMSPPEEPREQFQLVVVYTDGDKYEHPCDSEKDAILNFQRNKQEFTNINPTHPQWNTVAEVY